VVLPWSTCAMMAIFLRSVRSVSINLQVPIHEEIGLFHKKTSANQADVILQGYNPIRLERFWIEASCHLSGLGKIINCVWLGLDYQVEFLCPPFQLL